MSVVDISTWQNVFDLVYATIRDNETDQVLVTKAQIGSWADQCLYEMAEQAMFLDLLVEWNATVDSAEYELNSTGAGTLGLWRMEVDDEVIWPTTRRDLYRDNREWQTRTGQPRWYYLDGLQSDATATGLVVGLHPVPNSTISLRAYLSVVPDAYDSTKMSNRVKLPRWAVPGLVWGILAMVYSAENRIQNDRTAALYRMMYEDTIDRLKVRSFSRSIVSSAYGEGTRKAGMLSWRNLVPSDFIDYP